MDCIFSVKLGTTGLIGVFAGMAIGWVFKYATALRNPENPEIDAQMGRAIYAVCAIAGMLLGIMVQTFVEGCPKSPFF